MRRFSKLEYDDVVVLQEVEKWETKKAGVLVHHSAPIVHETARRVMDCARM